MNNSTLITDPYIFCLDNTLSKQECQDIINKFEKDIDKTRQGVVGKGLDLAIKNSRDLQISSLKNWQKEDELFFKIISSTLNKYYEHLNFGHNFTSFTTGELYEFFPSKEDVTDTGYQIQKTDPGKGYVWHHDARFDKDKSRELTYILYLNDVDEGWTQFYNGNQIEPKAGRVVIFPATWTYLHQGYPPKQTKYLMTGWLHVGGNDGEN
tara:strand:- start:1057 stop:1683 length:627 start_codon:yes stop_codon:yes gene_type:complete